MKKRRPKIVLGGIGAAVGSEFLGKAEGWEIIKPTRRDVGKLALTWAWIGLAVIIAIFLLALLGHKELANAMLNHIPTLLCAGFGGYYFGQKSRQG